MIDLVAVAYQAPAETAQMLDSIQNIGAPFTLTIVENNSPDPRVRDLLHEWLETAPPNCDVIFNEQNVGYARAINLGAQAGTSPYLAALNCDIKFMPGCIERIIEYFDAYPDVAVIGPRTTDSFGRLTHAGILVQPNHRDEHRAWLQPDNIDVRDVLDVRTVSGATYFMRRSVWNDMTQCPMFRSVAPDALGGFLLTPHYYEETWYSYHVRAHGHRVVYLGTTHMIHEWQKSSPIGSISLGVAEDQFRQACAAHGIELSW